MVILLSSQREIREKSMKRSLFAAFALIASVAAASAQSLPAPQGEVILTVGGNISISNAEGHTAQFDRSMLEAIGMFEIETSKPFTDSVIVFSGPLSRDVLEAVGTTGETIVTSALDDYSTSFLFTDAATHDFILAIDDDQGLISPGQFGPI